MKVHTALAQMFGQNPSRLLRYGRINGYERFDGNASPSNAAFVVVAIQNYSSVPPVGAVVRGIGQED